jgi:hypothetical protein
MACLIPELEEHINDEELSDDMNDVNFDEENDDDSSSSDNIDFEPEEETSDDDDLEQQVENGKEIIDNEMYIKQQIQPIVESIIEKAVETPMKPKVEKLIDIDFKPITVPQSLPIQPTPKPVQKPIPVFKSQPNSPPKQNQTFKPSPLVKQQMKVIPSTPKSFNNLMKKVKFSDNVEVIPTSQQNPAQLFATAQTVLKNMTQKAHLPMETLYFMLFMLIVGISFYVYDK